VLVRIAKRRVVSSDPFFREPVHWRLPFVRVPHDLSARLRYRGKPQNLTRKRWATRIG
jgi:hypothetical protein